MFCGITNIRLGLAWLSVDNTDRLDSYLENLLNLGLGGTIKSSAKFSKEADDLRVWVAFDRYCRVSNLI